MPNRLDPADLSLRQAIFLVENPWAMSRDFMGSEDRAWERVDELLAQARRERPPAWQAYEARCRRAEAAAVDAGPAHETILAALSARASLPEVPPMPEA